MTFLFMLKTELNDLVRALEAAETLDPDMGYIEALTDLCSEFMEKYEDAQRTEKLNEKEKKLLEDSLFYVQEAMNDLEEWDEDEDEDPDFGAAIDNAASGIKFGVLNKF
jgi:arginine/lysine/ornithine decarboxylase